MSDSPEKTLESLGLWDETAAANAREMLAERPRAAEAEYERDLGPADLEALSMPRAKVPIRSLVRIHASHHALARCIATGMRSHQAALVTGYSSERISSLQKDPAFAALVADYQREAQSVFADLGNRMYEFSLDALEILQERLQTDPGTFTVPVLLDLVTKFADRTGYGPGSSVHVTMTKDVIDRPPRESFEDWEARRLKELAPPDKLN